MDVDPAIARKKELVQQDKANRGSQEMREDAIPKTSALTEEERQHLDLNENINARLANPLEGISHERLRVMGRAFAEEKGLAEYADTFEKAAILAQDPGKVEGHDFLNEEEAAVLLREKTNRWDQPWQLYWLVITCSVAAAVQGMDESVTNGANLFWAPQFGLNTKFDPAHPNRDLGKNQWLLGLTAGAPYLACATIGCWLTAPLNNAFGRRGAIFITATISAVTCIWSAVTNTWWHLFIARFCLGLGIGPKSATVPVFAAESTPPLVRGGLVMQWQMWTAFGIMLGTVSSLAFYYVPNKPGITGLNWRLMLGSAGFPAFLLMAQVLFLPESPRWLLGKKRHVEAFRSLQRLRRTDLQAARDLFFIHALLEEEATIKTGRSPIVELFAVPRNRRAVLASGIVMFMQQFCGINVNAYYSSTVFADAGFSEISALGASLGFGALNWIFAFPAVFTIDTFGRRNLLLTTFPLMSLFLLMTGMAFFIQPDVVHSTSRVAVVALGVYLHCIAYSPGEGPVPFTYSAEAFPLYVRDLGMSYATAVTWGFNFILALTFPRLLGAFKPQGAYGFYAAWCLVGFVLILLFVPETKGLSLEELDQVFSVPTGKHAKYQLKALPYNIQKHIFRRKNMPHMEPLYHWGKEESNSNSSFHEKGKQSSSEKV